MFVDEAQIRVEAGHGGAGCLSFRREKHIPQGGPDGGNGGRGGSIFLIPDPHLNTLVDFQYDRLHRAQNGRPGAGRDSTGRSGEDLYIKVPLGTMIFDADTREMIDEIKIAEQSVLVAKGGSPGLGNACFKSSTNRSPRRTTPGTEGEQRILRLELRLLADVGLVGMPNAGKSSFIRRVTNARPKVASYPFTTLKPSLGVVAMDTARSYTIADIPGLIEGAASGTGLGIRFLKHIQHTRLIFHLVDLAESEDIDELVNAIATIEKELGDFDQQLMKRMRWLVLNKCDLFPKDMVNETVDAILRKSGWSEKHFVVSAITGENCRRLAGEAMTWLEQNPAEVSRQELLEIYPV